MGYKIGSYGFRFFEASEQKEPYTNVKGCYGTVSNTNYKQSGVSSASAFFLVPSNPNSNCTFTQVDYYSGNTNTYSTTPTEFYGVGTPKLGVLWNMSGGEWRDNMQSIIDSDSGYTFIGCPIFLESDYSSIFAYINNGDFSGALNHSDLEEKLKCNWTFGYTQADNTTYSLAFDNEQFYDNNSKFYGNAEISTAFLSCNYEIGGQLVNVHSLTIPYGTTWCGTLADIIGQSGTDIAENIINKVTSITSLSSLTFEFYLMCGNERSAQGYIEMNHSTLESYGFSETTHGDTISFKSGEVLDDTNSDISNPDITDETGDTLPTESLPDVTGTGLLTTSYSLTKSQAQGIGAFLWGADFLTNIKLINNNPIENIISCKLFPLDITSGVSENVKIGNVQTQTSGVKLSDTLLKYESNSYTIPKYYTDNLDFMNYAPYTKIEIYLPFIGLKEIPTDGVINKSVKITWIIDLVTGTLQTNLWIAGRLQYIFNSNIGADIPLTAQNLSQVESAYIQNAIGGGVSLASGNIVGVANAVINSATTQYHTQTTGTPSPNTSVVSLLTPYILITRCKTFDIGNVSGSNDKRSIYKQMRGCPLYKVKNLGNVKGYTQVYQPQIQIDGALKKEIDEINHLLEQGVILA